MSLHRLAELRSLAYHRAVAERLVRDPAFLAEARRRLEAWLDEGRSPHHARAWLELVDGPRERLFAFLVEDSERGAELRQSTPFSGAIEPHERWALWREVREAWEAQR